MFDFLKKRKLVKPRDQYINPITGAGTGLDKTSQSYFSPTLIQSRSYFEAVYVESWAASKFINIPVDDMFVKWREIYDLDPILIDRIKEAEKQFAVKPKLSMALKCGRLHGTGLFVILTKTTSTDKPLDVNRMLPGDLANIIVVDRFDATVTAYEKDPMNPNYGKPLYYRVNISRGGSFVAHHSRILRFDGISPLSDTGWQTYNQDWGVSSLIPVIREITQDADISANVSQLVNEASIGVQKVSGFEDAVSSDGVDQDLTTRLQTTNMLRSMYRTLYMDTEDDYTRVNASFSGLPEILDRSAQRLAAAADIPETRFWSKSIVGFQSTGDGEQRNYALKIASDQVNKLDGPMKIIDSVLAAHIGLRGVIPYKWLSIMDLSEDDKIKNAEAKVRIVSQGVMSGVITEDEARSIMSGDDIIGDLEPLESWPDA